MTAIDIDDLEAALGKLDIYRAGLSYRETAQLIAAQLAPSPRGERVQVIETQRLLYAKSARAMRGTPPWVICMDGDTEVGAEIAEIPAEAGLYPGRTASGEEVTVLYDPAKVTLT
jgi:hypothetical protein